MATKTTTKKTAKTAAPKAEAKEVKEKTEKSTPYFYGVGRRKTAVAQVRLYPADKVAENDHTVNGRVLKEYFGTVTLETIAMAPLVKAGMDKAFRVSVVVRGGGPHGQADAVKLGVARALVKHDAFLRPTLKAEKFLSRDARAVERKKPGLKKARRAPQWSKR